MSRYQQFNAVANTKYKSVCSPVLSAVTTHELAKMVQSRRNPKAHQLDRVYRGSRKPQEPHEKFFGEFLSMASSQVKLSKAV